MLVEDFLNQLDEMFDQSWSLPLSGNKSVIDAEKARELIDEIRVSLPHEFQQAEAIMNDRANIIAKANEEAEALIRKAEERARVILAQDEAVKAAQQKGTQLLSQAQTQSREMRLATHKFTDNVLRQSEEALSRSLEELRATRKALRGTGQMK